MNTDTNNRESSSEKPAFEFKNLPTQLKKNIHSLGWTEPMPVQSHVVPYILSSNDVIVLSRTGSGKTGAFLLPLCMKVDSQKNVAQALVLVPTRELAEQVNGVLKLLTNQLGIRSTAVYGGVAYEPQIEAFREYVHIIVATPGRIIDQ